VCFLIRYKKGLVGGADNCSNLYQTKQRSGQKIDAAVALMMAVEAMDANAGLEGFLSNPLFA